MSEFFSVMTWPLLACLLLPGMLVYLGLHIVKREIIFVDLALAQVAALGACLGLLLDYEVNAPQTYLFSLGFTFVGAIIFTFTRNRRNHQVPQEAIIGIVYVVAAAASILLLSKGSAEANEQIKRTLIGDVLTVDPKQILRTFCLYLAVGAIHVIFRKKFLLISFEPERAQADRVRVLWWDFLFYVLFGFVVTSFVQIGGVLLIFSYLIVPAVCANFLARRLRSLLLVGWGTATLASMVGLYASYQYDFPTGAAIVCVLGIALVLAAAAASLRVRLRRTAPEPRTQPEGNSQVIGQPNKG
jgi:zinc/manganese transport system permease protein